MPSWLCFNMVGCDRLLAIFMPKNLKLSTMSTLARIWDTFPDVNNKLLCLTYIEDCWPNTILLSLYLLPVQCLVIVCDLVHRSDVIHKFLDGVRVEFGSTFVNAYSGTENLSSRCTSVPYRYLSLLTVVCEVGLIEFLAIMIKDLGHLVSNLLVMLSSSLSERLASA